MAKRRYSGSDWSQKGDKFNDEHRRDKSPMKSGPYHYDREERENYRQGERAAYRKMASAEHYAGMEPRRRQELEDMGMIHEDHREIANLPQNVMMKPYNYESGYLPEDLDDTIRGIERQKDYDNGKKMEHFYPKKV